MLGGIAEDSGPATVSPTGQKSVCLVCHEEPEGLLQPCGSNGGSVVTVSLPFPLSPRVNDPYIASVTIR